MVDGDNSTAFSLNDSPAQHLQLLVDNMNRITGSDVWRIGQVVDSENVNVEYDCISCFDGLGKLAEATKTEWWVEGYTMNLVSLRAWRHVGTGLRQWLAEYQ